ncbi:uncharacterized protein G2W53_009442 [Senna tora]|uniref:Uncharacterized protein n=1 Tax=Senna tora TaxID=362788 RepID=A0A834WYZ6_9FABA|nr:uncharacterized protein G2W53_009442 [Senna tora]
MGEAAMKKEERGWFDWRQKK